MSDIVLSNQMNALKIGRKISSFTGVIIHAGKDAKGKDLNYKSGSTSGRVLEFDHPFGTQEMADRVLASLALRGVPYQPFESLKTPIDPAAEIGDGVSVGGKSAVIWNIKTPHNNLLDADVSAPYDEELEHEWKYEPRQYREFKRESGYTRARLSISQDEIKAEVVRATAAETTLSGSLSVQADRITSEVMRAKGSEQLLSSRITQTADAITSEVTRATAAEGNLGTRIDQRLDSITLSVTSSNGSTVFKLKDGSAELDTETLDLSVKAVNVSGTLKAAQIDTGAITVGKLDDAAKAQIVKSSKTQTQYYLSTSNTSATGGSWSNAQPTWTAGKYIWTREKTTDTFLDNTTSDTYAPNENGRYDKNLTTALSTSEPASGAQSKSSLIYRSAAAGNLPTAPSAWVTDTSGDQNKWTQVRPEYSQNYPALYVATQSEKLDGTFSCTTPYLDTTTTVIDGASIITGSISANKVAVTDLSAFEATIGGWTIENKRISKGGGSDDLIRVYINAPTSPSDTDNAISVATRETTSDSFVNKIGLSYGGKLTARDADISGKITATSGTIGGCSITDGVLQVPAANITGTLNVGQLPAKAKVTSSTTISKFALSSSNSTAPTTGWQTSLPAQNSAKPYLWVKSVTTVTYSDNTTQETEGTPYCDTSLSGAAQRSQTIYRSTSGGTAPTAPSAWVSDSSGDQGKWTTVRPVYNSSYPALYIAQQKETVGGTLTTSTPALDATTTVIDGSHITTGTIDAARINVNGDLRAFNATIGGWTINPNNLERATDLIRIRLYAPETPTSSSNAISVASRETTNDNWISAFSVTYGGKVTCSDIKITGGEMTGGKVGGASVGSGSFGGITIPSTGTGAGQLVVPENNIADGAITENKILNACITAAKIKLKEITYGQIADNTLTTGQFVSTVNDSLGYASTFGHAIQQYTGTYPGYFTAGDINAKSHLYTPYLGIGSYGTTFKYLKVTYQNGTEGYEYVLCGVLS